MLAELSGFKELFISFKDFFFFKEQAQKLISRDLNKLDGAIRIIFGLMDFRELIAKRNKTLEDILPKEKIAISMFDAEKYIAELDMLVNEKIDTFEAYLTELFLLYKNGSALFKNKLKELIPPSEFGYTLEGFYKLLNNDLPISKLIPEKKRLDKIKQVININLPDYIKWYEFVSETSNELTKFHTYHSTKGLEYNNVIIIMENSFAGSKSYFPDFFKDPNRPEFKERRNLLYVTCSRAVFHMRILYLDSIDSFKDDISSFFGKAQTFSITDDVNL